MIILSLSVGIAITIISSGVVHANVESFLFGSILTVTRQDVWSVLFLSVVSLAMIVRLYPQLVLLTFDEDGAKIAGVRYRLINYAFAVLVAATISVSIRIVGILVISSSSRCPWRRPCSSRRDSGAPWNCPCCSASSTSWGPVPVLLDRRGAGGVTALVSVAVLLAVIAGRSLVPARRS